MTRSRTGSWSASPPTRTCTWSSTATPCNAALKIDPSAAVRAIVDEVLKFEMPGAGIPGFMRKAADIAKAGIYDLRVHRDEVLLPILRHWGIFELTGLDGAAEEARRRLAEHLEKLDAAARRFEDRMARTTSMPRNAATG